MGKFTRVPRNETRDLFAVEETAIINLTVCDAKLHCEVNVVYGYKQNKEPNGKTIVTK